MRDETSSFILLHIINTTSVTTRRQNNHQVFLFLKFFLHEVKYDVKQYKAIKVIKHLSSGHVRAHWDWLMGVICLTHRNSYVLFQVEATYLSRNFCLFSVLYDSLFLFRNILRVMKARSCHICAPWRLNIRITSIHKMFPFNGKNSFQGFYRRFTRSRSKWESTNKLWLTLLINVS